MNLQAPTTTLHHRPMQAALAAVAALVVAGGTLGVLAITSDDAGTTQSSGTAVTSVAPDRVLDGSPILRGTSASAVSSRVLDGSPILRGTASQPVYAYRHAIAPASLRKPSSAGTVSTLDGSPILRGHAAAAGVTHVSSVQGTQRPGEARPFGFGFRP